MYSLLTKSDMSKRVQLMIIERIERKSQPDTVDFCLSNEDDPETSLRTSSFRTSTGEIFFCSERKIFVLTKR